MTSIKERAIFKTPNSYLYYSAQYRKALISASGLFRERGGGVGGRDGASWPETGVTLSSASTNHVT